jgi:hypothetical protein
MLVVMDFHRLRIDVGLEGFFGVGQVGQCVRHDDLSFLDPVSENFGALPAF